MERCFNISLYHGSRSPSFESPAPGNDALSLTVLGQLGLFPVRPTVCYNNQDSCRLKMTGRLRILAGRHDLIDARHRPHVEDRIPAVSLDAPFIPKVE